MNTLWKKSKNSPKPSKISKKAKTTNPSFPNFKKKSKNNPISENYSKLKPLTSKASLKSSPISSTMKKPLTSNTKENSQKWKMKSASSKINPKFLNNNFSPIQLTSNIPKKAFKANSRPSSPNSSVPKKDKASFLIKPWFFKAIWTKKTPSSITLPFKIPNFKPTIITFFKCFKITNLEWLLWTKKLNPSNSKLSSLLIPSHKIEKNSKLPNGSLVRRLSKSKEKKMNLKSKNSESQKCGKKGWK